MSIDTALQVSAYLMGVLSGCVLSVLVVQVMLMLGKEKPEGRRNEPPLC